MNRDILHQKLEKLRHAYNALNLEWHRHSEQLEWKRRSERLKSLGGGSGSASASADKPNLNVLRYQIQAEELRFQELSQEMADLAIEIESLERQISIEDYQGQELSLDNFVLEEFTYKYHVGGPLTADDYTYIKRQADDDFFNGLIAGEFCYVFSARQMGKSSLRVRTAAKLRESDVICITLLASMIIGNSDNLTEELWYRGVINHISLDVGLYKRFNDEKWWNSQAGLSSVQRFSKFIKTILLPTVSQPVVIFIDEIDRILSLNFSLDGFFAAIREFYNSRAELPIYNKLTFAMLGVAAPTALIRDAHSTPFNIGRSIYLTGFTGEESQPLIYGLRENSVNPKALLSIILRWTGGQPFLTQKLCHLVQVSGKLINDGEEEKWIANLVQSHIVKSFGPAQIFWGQDVYIHLKSISDRILLSFRARKLLALYRSILHVGFVELEDSAVQLDLCLSGLATVRQNKLLVSNLIYREIFNLSWIKKSVESLTQNPYARQIQAWVSSGYQDQSCLLYGDVLKKALHQAESLMLAQENKQFLLASKALDQQLLFLADPQEQQLVLQDLFRWTGGYKPLNELVLRLLRHHKRPMNQSVELWIERTIETKVLTDWESSSLGGNLLQAVASNIKNSTVCSPMWLLIAYRSLLISDVIDDSFSEEKTELQRIGIIRQRSGQIAISGLIYAKAFDLMWVNRSISGLCPYARKLVAWTDSGESDRTQLLSARELEIAHEWSVGKKLDKRDYSFLVESMLENT